jgi:hypothetical protein
MVCRPQDECSPGTRLNVTYLPVEKPSTARWSPMVVTTIVVPRRTNAQHWVSTSHQALDNRGRVRLRFRNSCSV